MVVVVLGDDTGIGLLFLIFPDRCLMSDVLPLNVGGGKKETRLCAGSKVIISRVGYATRQALVV